MSSTSSKSVDEHESSLADSTYEVVDPRNLVSDDELDVQSESLPSCGGNTTDCEVSSVADTEEYVDNQASITSLPPSDYPTPAPSEDDEEDDGNIVEESSTTVRPTNASKSKLIQFPEPTRYERSGQNEGTALVKQQIGTALAEEFSLDLQHSNPSPQVPIGLQMRLSEKPILPLGSFSVMFVGHLSDARKEALVHKIASALATGYTFKSTNQSAPTRLNVVPMRSFGLSESCPDVAVIESNGTELLVETCKQLKKVCDRKGRVQLLEAEINDEWVDMRTNKRLSMNKLQSLPHTPHLAIFLHGAVGQTETRHGNNDWIWDIEEVLYDRGTPAIHLANKAEWALDPLDSGSDGVLQMTARMGKNAEAISPVDVDTFLRLHNGQLGRHLSFLESVRRGIGRKKSSFELFTSPFTSIPSRLSIMLTILIALITLSTMSSFILRTDWWTKIPRIQETAVERASVLNSSLIKLTNSTTAISAPPFNSLLSNVKPPEDTIERGAYLRLSEAIANGTEKFEAYPFADHFIAIKAPTSFARLKNTPNLYVNASRSGEALDANISKLAFEHYAMTLKQGQSYGQVNLTIFTKDKPLIRQSIMVNLGSLWRNPSAMNALVEAGLSRGWEDIESFRSSLSGIASRLIAKVAKDVREAKDTFRPAIAEATRSGSDASFAAGAATWETLKFARSQAVAELSRACAIFPNSSRTRQALQSPQQVLGRFSTRARSVLASAKYDSSRTVAPFTSRFSKAQEDLSKKLTHLRQRTANVQRPSSWPAEVARKGLPIEKMRNRAVSVWEKVFGKKPVSKALGASLMDVGMRCNSLRASREYGVIRMDSDPIGHAKTGEEAKKKREQRENLRKAAKQRKAPNGHAPP
ncbi:hypothetical protein EV356DRAFT_504121 [Viridothelium virens]|uniref:Uncharacterized protein n=1 Tax=Viridothelium virens TaxID=1048519 RepID=A0A6A6HL83_VIRVR|nr:hypothetical protein EV356DRAFT_504121 [Viridothelium virens]